MSLGTANLDEVCDVHRHLVNLRVVELLNGTEGSDIVLRKEVDRDALTTETAGTTDSVDVVLEVGGQIVVDDQ